MVTEEPLTGSVVVGTDGSANAELAVDWAAREAARRGAGLHVVYAFPWVTHAQAWDFEPPPEVTETGERVMSAVVDRVHEAHPGIPVTREVVVESPAEALVEASRHAAVVVVGSGGLGETDDALMGSVAQKVAAHAACAVVVVRDVPPAGEDAPVVVGMDPEEGAPDAMEYAFEEAGRRGTHLVVVQASQDDIALLEDIPVLGDHYREVARLHAEHTAERLETWRRRFPHVPAELRLVHERPVRALVHAAAEASIVVVGSRGRSGLAGLLLGSVSRGVANRAPVVAVVRTHHDAR